MVALSKNVAKGERTLRIIFGVILILLGFFLPGLWKFVFIIIGILLLITACVGY